MLGKFYPYEYVESIFDIDYEELYKRGYRALIFDVDDTLVPADYDSNEEVDDFFRKIQAIGFKTILLSNNCEERILSFLKNIDSPYIANAQKPYLQGYEKALEFLQVDKNQVIMIGDQIFTDVLGANRFNIPNILVKFIGFTEKKYLGKRRTLESVILYFYSKNKKMNSRIFK